jgi:transcriptional regulator with XRE-family HTH domain
MTTLHSPTAGRRRLRHALRHARDLTGMTQEQVAEAMDWSLSKIIRIETGTVSISTNDLRQLLQLYGVDDRGQVAELVELARIGRRKPWWTRYRDSVPPQYLSYVGLEDEAVAMRCFYPQGMPGLLQTEEFAHALVDASLTPGEVGSGPQVGPGGPTADAADRVDMRMIRQREVLGRQVPPQLTAVLDEAVLRREIGGAAVLRRQLLHLVGLGTSPHVTIRVLPFTAHLVNILSPFVILEFTDPHDTDVVFAESSFEQTVIDDPAGVATYRRVFSTVEAASLPENASLELIARIAGELG